MRARAYSCISSLLFVAVLTAPAGAHDWPQYRGPQRDGISRETGWKVEGAKDDLWTTNVGLGYSAVAVSGGRLYTQGFDKDAGLDVIFCFDPVSGEELWSYTHPSKIWAEMHDGGTLATPAVDGDRVFVTDREGIFLCLDAATGEEIWKQDLKERYGVTPPKWGFSASPLVLDEKLVLNAGKTIAVDKKTGEKLWETRDSGHAYSTPTDFQLAGRPSLAVFNGSGLVVFARDKGEELFFHEWKTTYDINAMTPVAVGEKIFISSGLNRGCALLDPAHKDKPVVFESKQMRNQLSGCVLWNDHLYGFDEEKLKCIDVAGSEKWTERSVSKGALSLADGKLIVINAEGELVIATAAPDKYEELSRTKVLDGGVYWTPPVLANGLIYCRSNLGDIVCRDHRAEKSKN